MTAPGTKLGSQLNSHHISTMGSGHVPPRCKLIDLCHSKSPGAVSSAWHAFPGSRGFCDISCVQCEEDWISRSVVIKDCHVKLDYRRKSQLCHLTCMSWSIDLTSLSISVFTWRGLRSLFPRCLCRWRQVPLGPRSQLRSFALGAFRLRAFLFLVWIQKAAGIHGFQFRNWPVRKRTSSD